MYQVVCDDTLVYHCKYGRKSSKDVRLHLTPVVLHHTSFTGDDNYTEIPKLMRTTPLQRRPKTTSSRHCTVSQPELQKEAITRINKTNIHTTTVIRIGKTNQQPAMHT